MPRGRRPGLLPGAGTSPCFRVPHQNEIPAPRRARYFEKQPPKCCAHGRTDAEASKNHGKSANFWEILFCSSTCTVLALDLCRAAPLPMALSSLNLSMSPRHLVLHQAFCDLHVWVTAALWAPLGWGAMLGLSSQKGTPGRARTTLPSHRMTWH